MLFLLFMTVRKSGRKCCHASRDTQVWSLKIFSRQSPRRQPSHFVFSQKSGN
jgi:hypothetical protein